MWGTHVEEGEGEKLDKQQDLVPLMHDVGHHMYAVNKSLHQCLYIVVVAIAPVILTLPHVCCCCVETKRVNINTQEWGYYPGLWQCQ